MPDFVSFDGRLIPLPARTPSVLCVCFLVWWYLPLLSLVSLGDGGGGGLDIGQCRQSVRTKRERGVGRSVEEPVASRHACRATSQASQAPPPLTPFLRDALAAGQTAVRACAALPSRSSSPPSRRASTRASPCATRPPSTFWGIASAPVARESRSHECRDSHRQLAGTRFVSISVPQV